MNSAHPESICGLPMSFRLVRLPATHHKSARRETNLALRQLPILIIPHLELANSADEHLPLMVPICEKGLTCSV
jgi:hypothetical protein